MKPVEREAKNRLLAITPPAPLCFTFHSLPLLLLLIFLPLFYRSASLSSIMPPSTLIIKILYFIHILLGLCKLQQSRLCFVCEILRCKGRHSPPLRLCWRRLSQVSSLLCVCVFMCVFDVCVASAAAGVAGEALGWRWDRQAHDQTVQINRVSGFSWWGLGRQPGNCKCLRACW